MEENKNRKTRKGVGRKPKTDPAVYRYVVRLNSEENVKFDIQFQKSGLRERSKFIKAMIFGKEIKVVRIDKATMDYYVRLTNFYHQFQAIGNNYNQTVKAIKNNFGRETCIRPAPQSGKDDHRSGGAEQADHHADP